VIRAPFTRPYGKNMLSVALAGFRMGVLVLALLVLPTWEAECLAVVIFGREGFR
jgi:hypothetical protein